MKPFPTLVTLQRDPLFYGVVAVSTLACLWPLWHYRFLPMQDYPQHLFLAYVIATYDTPGFDWGQYYSVDLRVGPYSLEYWLMRAFSTIAGIETAGKLFFSLYVLLMALLVLRAARRSPPDHTPWVLLLVFPLVFNQTYFLGFQNYLLSLPLLFLALLDLDEFAAKPITWLGAARHGLILIALFLCHPFTTLIYVALALTGLVYSRGDRGRRMAWPIGVTVVVFSAWAMSQGEAPSPLQHGEWKVWWWDFEGLWEFFVMMFTGMRINGGVNIAVTIVWTALAVVIIAAAIRAPVHAIARSRATGWFAVSILGYLVLPYWFGYYAFFNVRLAPVAMLAFALSCADLKMARGLGYAVAGLCVILVAFSGQIHGEVSRETEEILPVLEKMERNARVLPMYLNSNTRVLDPEYFYELHTHDHSYYHILIGGGASPFLFPNPMLPVRYRADVRLPAPNLKDPVVNFDWRDIHSRYRYILVRGDEPELLMRYLVQSTRVIAHSGSWSLFENPP